MSTCKDCLHYDVCECEDCLIRVPEWVNKVEDFCGCFKPIADYVEVKHGYWKQTKEPLGVHDVDCIECSVCGESWILDEDWSFEEHTEYCHYCINCGAKMDGERKESEVQGE